MDANQLCLTCRTISFEQDDTPTNNSTKDGKWNWKSILDLYRQPNCPLCRLTLFHLMSESSLPPSTKPISLLWVDGSKYLGSFLAPIYMVQELSSGPSKNRLGRPVTESRIDLRRARWWLDWCLDNHKECHAPHTAERPISLRVINVVTRCIETIRTPCRYIALSYVWGGSPSIRLTNSNLEKMSEPGILTYIWEKIPRTIRDAMEAVQELNEKYLWVDLLCLIQNDGNDMRSGIVVMDLIYEKALLTIIAASGGHSDAGLPGVGGTFRFINQRIEQIQPGVRFACHLDVDYLLKQTVYYQRGWTFQEQILSRRSLIFMNNQVYFRCRKHQYSEDIIDPAGRYNPAHSIDGGGSLLPVAARLQDPCEDFSTILMYYSERTFSYPEDALPALAGISRRVSQQMKCRFFQGVPTASFDAYFVFSNFRSILRRRPQFPSYSWAGWIGRITTEMDFSRNVNDWLRDCTWIQWYQRSPSGVIKLVWDVMANEDFPVKDMEFVGYRKRYGFGSRFRINSSRILPTEELNLSKDVPPYPMLQFWTLSMRFEIYGFDVFAATAVIVDCDGRKCGRLNMDSFEDDEFFQTGAAYEFILVSESYSRQDPDCGYGHSPDQCQPAYNVLVMEWTGGIAERRGIGILCKSAIERALPPGPCWKEVVMQ